MRGQVIRLTTLTAALMLALAACIPGLGTMEPISVTVETPHIATVTYTPTVNVQDVIINVGGAETVRSSHPLFECEPYRSGHRCYIPGQDNASAPRVISPAGERIQVVAYAAHDLTEPGSPQITGSVFWQAVP